MRSLSLPSYSCLRINFRMEAKKNKLPDLSNYPVNSLFYHSSEKNNEIKRNTVDYLAVASAAWFECP